MAVAVTTRQAAEQRPGAHGARVMGHGGDLDPRRVADDVGHLELFDEAPEADGALLHGGQSRGTSPAAGGPAGPGAGTPAGGGTRNKRRPYWAMSANTGAATTPP